MIHGSPLHPVEHPHNLKELQASLDAYMDRDLGFAELRTRWITALADKPEMRISAVRLLYQQPADRHLTEERALDLKRIVESATQDEADDWTVAFGDDGRAIPTDSEKRAAKSTTQASAGTAVASARPENLWESVNRKSASQSTPAKSSSSSTLSPGHVLKDRFVLGEPLGRGGVGIVYLAHDRLRQRAKEGSAKIALKVLREEFRNCPERLDALQREALQVQGLSHPNIVRVHDFHQDGSMCFLTMELLEGEVLKTVFSRLQPGTMPLKRAMQIIAGMCRGLAHAHDNGLVHADFKPGNVFLTANDEPKILDFGLARVAVPGGQLASTSAKPSDTGRRTMTPAYASCNRLQGGVPSFSDDVYSLCCVIYELLAGKHPYDRKSALVVRELKLHPRRIESLTDRQWRTLSAGLRPLRLDRTTNVHDLLAAFEDQAPVQALSAPVRKRAGRNGAAAAPFRGFLLGSALVSVLAILAMQQYPSGYIDLARESEPVLTVQASLDNRIDALVAANVPAPTASLPIVDASSMPIEDDVANTDAESLPAPIADELVADTPVTEVSAQALAEVAVPDSVESFLEPADGLNLAAARDPDDPFLIPIDGQDATVASVLPGFSVDNQSAMPIAHAAGFQLDSGEYVIRESGTALAVEIRRHGDLSTRTSVEWTTFPGSAEPQLDYAASYRRQAYFAAGEASKTIFIPIVADATAERHETFQVGLSRPGQDMILAAPFTATVTIIDDDV